MRSRCSAGRAVLVAFATLAGPLGAQVDTTGSHPPLFTWRDALLGAGFVIGTVAARPVDASAAAALQRPRNQQNRVLHDVAVGVRTIADPGALIIGVSMYAVGRLSKEQHLAQLGLHGTEALVIGDGVAMVMKGFIGRARPYVDTKNPNDYQLLRGFRGGDKFRSFPSGHTVAGFAAAAAVTAETSHWWPSSVWYIGPTMYGGAALVGLSRMYDNRHWASDVITGAAIGTFAGTKVVRFHKQHPKAGLDRWLLKFSAPTSNLGQLSLSIVPGLGTRDSRIRPPSSQMKSGIVVMAELSGPLAARLREIQLRYDPRMAAELPPHITLSGSSGMGPMPSTTKVDHLHARLSAVARATRPFVVMFQPPMRFMQSNVVVLPIDPNGEIRALHERIKSCGLLYEPPRFTFTPHCTLSFYPELPRDRLRALLALRIDDPVTVDSIQAYRATDLRTEKVLDLPLGGD